MSLGIGPKYRGFQYTIYAVSPDLEDEERLFLRDTLPLWRCSRSFFHDLNCVERNIRTVIARLLEKQPEKAGGDCRLPYDKSSPPLRTFISIL